MLRTATWRSGYATVCKTVYSGSIPDVASNRFNDLAPKRFGGSSSGNPVGTQGACSYGLPNKSGESISSGWKLTNSPTIASGFRRT
jgi:hypothetical protein